jgi:hypothetical protein
MPPLPGRAVNPAERAQLDQGAAAERTAVRALYAAQLLAGQEPGTLMPEPIAETFVRRLTLRLSDGTTGWCPHALTGPQPLFWQVWLPRRVNCALCNRTALRKGKRSEREQSRCDGCHRLDGTTGGQFFQIPAKPAGNGVLIGPITIAAGLCAGCLAGGHP